MTKKYLGLICRHQIRFKAQNAPKSVFGPGSAPYPAGELTTLPQTPSRLARGIPPPHSSSHSTPSPCLELGAYGRFSGTH